MSGLIVYTPFSPLIICPFNFNSALYPLAVDTLIVKLSPSTVSVGQSTLFPSTVFPSCPSVETVKVIRYPIFSYTR